MSTKRKLAIFDFCGTIYKYQSADRYVDFVAKPNLRNKLLDAICRYLSRRQKYSGLIHKKVKLLKIRGLSRKALENGATAFLEQDIYQSLIPVVVEQLNRYLNDPDYDVFIASAGYDSYLQPFCEQKGIPFLAATIPAAKGDKATGLMQGYDCYGVQKVARIKKMIDLNNYDLEESVCFSDCLSDKPIFGLVGKKYFVKKTEQDYTIIHINNEVFTIL